LDFHGLVIGFIRYTANSQGDVEVGFYLTPGFQRRGLGRQLLKTTLPWAKKMLRARTFRTFVRQENIASARTLEGAGFVKVGSDISHNQACFIYELSD
jgi:RimJ/RimL family protein N-acetyltransferase